MSEDTEKTSAGQAEANAIEPIAEEIEAYPLRKGSEDPRWALRIIQVWVCMALFLLLFFVVLMILGIWYD